MWLGKGRVDECIWRCIVGCVRAAIQRPNKRMAGRKRSEGQAAAAGCAKTNRITDGAIQGDRARNENEGVQQGGSNAAEAEGGPGGAPEAGQHVLVQSARGRHEPRNRA